MKDLLIRYWVGTDRSYFDIFCVEDEKIIFKTVMCKDSSEDTPESKKAFAVLLDATFREVLQFLAKEYNPMDIAVSYVSLPEHTPKDFSAEFNMLTVARFIYDSDSHDANLYYYHHVSLAATAE